MTAGSTLDPLRIDDKADKRGSPIPTAAMITTRFMELRKRRGLTAALIVVTIGIPTLFLAGRLLLHAIAPKTYGPAGGYDIYTALSAGVLYVFGFIVAAALGCTAGSDDLTDGVFRHLVITGRSRVALYLARIPAGLAIIVPLVAIGFSIVCAVCVWAAPSTTTYGGLTVPAGHDEAAARDVGRRPCRAGDLRRPVHGPRRGASQRVRHATAAPGRVTGRQAARPDDHRNARAASRRRRAHCRPELRQLPHALRRPHLHR